MEMNQKFITNNSGNSSVSNENTAKKPRNTKDTVLPSDEYSNFLCV